MNHKKCLALALILALQTYFTFSGNPAATAQSSTVKQQNGGPQAACSPEQYRSFFEQFTYGKGPDSSPELEACSGDGHCKMNFEHLSGGKKLSVGTYGRPVLVRWWEIGKL